MRWLILIAVGWVAYNIYMSHTPTFTIEEIAAMPKGEAGPACFFPEQPRPGYMKNCRNENHSGYVMTCCY